MITNVCGRVTSVVSGAPAAAAGILPFDRIVSIDGSHITTDAEGALVAFTLALARSEGRFSIDRPARKDWDAIAAKENGADNSSPWAARPAVTKSATRGSSKRIKPAAASQEWVEQRAVVSRENKGEAIGLTVTKADLTGSPRCVVTGVLPGSAADKAGLLAGDVIASVNGAELKASPLSKLLQKRQLRDATELVFVVSRAAMGEIVPGSKVSLSDPRVIATTADL